MALRPVILAAGRETRFKGGDDGRTFKPLMEISGSEVGGPVTCQALYHLGRMAFAPHEIIIVVNEKNKDPIRRAIGDGAIKLVTQSLKSERTGPAAGLKAAYDADPTLDETLVIQADDAHWTGVIMAPYARHWDRRKRGAVASMALLSKGDPGVHFSTYYSDTTDERLLGYQAGLPEYRFPGQGCNAGLHVERRDSFITAYVAVSEVNEDPGIPAIVNYHLENALPVLGPIYDGLPWKSANTPAGLNVARAVAVSDRSGLELATLADTLAYATRTS